jgi:uncharacterized membrane protein
VTGVDQRGRWRLRELAGDRTRVTFRFAYGVAGGGLVGMIAERVASRSLSHRFQEMLLTIKRTVESQRESAAVG